MDEVDIESIAITVAGCRAFTGTMMRMRNVEGIRWSLLDTLAAEDDSGAPDPNHNRKLYASWIELMQEDELKSLCAFLVRIHAF